MLDVSLSPHIHFFNRKKNIQKKNFIRIYIGYINQSLLLHIFAGCGECDSRARTYLSSSFTRMWPVLCRGRVSFEPRISNANGYVLFITSVPFGTYLYYEPLWTYLYYEPLFYTISCLVGKHLTVSAWNRRGTGRIRTFVVRLTAVSPNRWTTVP